MPGNERRPPAIAPLPPLAQATGLAWDVAVDDAVAAIAEARDECGDTFVVDSGRDRYLFTFSPTGVESFYALPEDQASKGVADYLMLRRKLPDEIFDGRRTLPSSLFRKGDVASYLVNLEHALDQAIDELGADGIVDIFELTRRLGHRMGLASWAGPGTAEGAEFEALIEAFDALDGAEAFVHPDAMAEVQASGKAKERAALAEIAQYVGAAADRLDLNNPAESLFRRIVDEWNGEPDDVRRQGIAFDVALIHIASMSNLASALGWALVDLIEHPDEMLRVRAGDEELAAQCALESTRMAQRSIMARTVLQPVAFDTGDVTYAVEPGVTIATLLPLTNTAGDSYDRWEPSRWNRNRIADTSGLASPQLVTAFGHGKHSCPAQPFSVSAMTMAVQRLFSAFDLEAGWTSHPRPVSAQIGGVARSASPTLMRYRRR